MPKGADCTRNHINSCQIDFPRGFYHNNINIRNTLLLTARDLSAYSLLLYGLVAISLERMLLLF